MSAEVLITQHPSAVTDCIDGRLKKINSQKKNNFLLFFSLIVLQKYIIYDIYKLHLHKLKRINSKLQQQIKQNITKNK